MIETRLTHRLTLRRATTTYDNLAEPVFNPYGHLPRPAGQPQVGSPRLTWLVIATGIPCLVSKESSEFDPTWTPTQATEAGSRATLFARAGADIRPGDRVVITRPDLGTYLVLPDDSAVLNLSGVHHKEFKIRSV